MMMDSEKECAICLVEMDMEKEKTSVLPCKHVFHERCASSWLEGYQSTCPLCRSEVAAEGGGEVFEYWRRMCDMVSDPDVEVDWGLVREYRRRAWEICDRDPDGGAYRLELFGYWLWIKDLITPPVEEIDWEGLIHRPWFDGDPDAEVVRDNEQFEYSERILDTIVNAEPHVEEDWDEVVSVDPGNRRSDDEEDSQLAYESGFDWDKLVEYFERNWDGDDLSAALEQPDLLASEDDAQYSGSGSNSRNGVD